MGSRDFDRAKIPRGHTIHGMHEPEPLEFVGVNEVRLRGRKLLYFSGCDYLRLARDPRLVREAGITLQKYGLSVAASRVTTGNHKIYLTLESALAKFFASETAVVVPDGYFAPIVAAQALARDYSHVFIDEFAHGALRDAARMFDCTITPFKHKDAADLRRLIAQCGPASRPIVLTDGLFGHDGSVAPLREYLTILPKNGLLLVDDAHGAGTIGATGKGSLEYEGVKRQRVVQCATLSKAFGAYGGVILGSSALRKRILERSRPFTGTTPLPLPLAGAALEALKLLKREPDRRKRLKENQTHVRNALRAAGWEIADAPGPMIRLPAMKESLNAKLRARLLKAGIYPPFLKYGNTSSGGSFRFIISSEHTRAQLDKVIALLTDFRRL